MRLLQILLEPRSVRVALAAFIGALWIGAAGFAAYSLFAPSIGRCAFCVNDTCHVSGDCGHSCRCLKFGSDIEGRCVSFDLERE